MSDPTASPSDPATTPTPPVVAPIESRPQYEFDDAQNQVINDLAFAIIWVRLPLIVAGILQAMIAVGLAFRVSRDGAHIVGVLGHAMAAAICFMLSGWLLQAASAFTKVTTTTGRDISYMMTALKNLGAWFDLLAFFVKLYLALLGLLLAILLVGLLFGAFRESM
ncbi:MAG: hypothetical protein C0467_16615 [Planctomycetaceae bacterium]|nr:hypothetical protein [Planctomycetaceae bacterium]